MTRKDALILAVLVAANLALQQWSYGKLVIVGTDEGVYLYTAKLILAGHVPYRDFVLAHAPFLLYVLAGLMGLAGGDVDIVRFAHSAFFLTALVPIYVVALEGTRSRVAATSAALLFSTFVELVQWDARQVALRQMSMPLLAFAILFAVSHPRPRLAGLLLGLFAASLPSNVFVALALLAALFLAERAARSCSLGAWLRSNAPLLAVFLAVTATGYAPVFLIPNGARDLLGFQLSRPVVPLGERVEAVCIMMSRNWPIFLFGLLGSLIRAEDPRTRPLAVFNALSLAALVLLGRSFYPHYLVVLGVGLSLSAAVLVARVARSGAKAVVVASLVLSSLGLASLGRLKVALIDSRSPDFFAAVRALEGAPEPVLCFEPIYALYARRELTFHDHVADMRVLKVLGRRLDERTSSDLVLRSGTVVLEPFTAAFLSPPALAAVREQFEVVYADARAPADRCVILHRRKK